MGVGMILTAFLAALGQLGDPRFRQVLLLGIGLSLALLFGVYVLFLGLVQVFVGKSLTLPLIGAVTWVDDLISWSSMLIMLLLSAFLMVPVASAITSMFLDRIAQAVEDRHYPGLPPARSVPLPEALADTATFLGILIVANLLALILYAVFTAFAPLIFWALNGFLLGREYFTLVASRRLGRPEARALLARHRGTVWLAGTLMAVPLSLPLVNLVVPILGAATFTHVFHRLQRGG